MDRCVSSRAVFLDRDGTLNVAAAPHEYITSAADFAWLNGAREAIASIIDLGYLVAVVSNQRGVGRGLVSVSAIQEIEDRMQADLGSIGYSIDAFRYCFHLNEDACSCRKPAPGMLLSIAAERDIDLPASWMVGDAQSDVEAGRAAGCRTALIRATPTTSDADLVVASLKDFVEILATGSYS